MRMNARKAITVTSVALLAGTWSTSSQALIIIGSCSVSATSVLFGTYDPASFTPRNGTGTVTLNCTIVLGLLDTWTLLLSRGGSSTYLPRRLASGANTLNYNLYTNAARTTVWGDGSAGTSTMSNSSTLSIGTSSVEYTVYGQIPARQDRPPGTYSDSITVTVNY